MGSLPHPPGVVTPPSTSPWSPGAGDSSCRGTRLARASSCGEVGPSAGSARVCSTSSSRPDRRWAPARRLRDRSRLHAGGLHCQVRRAYLPQHRCRRRSLCPGRRRHAAPEVPLPRDPMRRSAGLGGSRHLAASPRRPFWEHCVDSWTLAASSVGGTVPETPAVLRLSPVWLHRQHPHRLEPTRGGARRPSGGPAAWVSSAALVLPLVRADLRGRRDGWIHQPARSCNRIAPDTAGGANGVHCAGIQRLACLLPGPKPGVSGTGVFL
jgi:hypothetical protein